MRLFHSKRSFAADSKSATKQNLLVVANVVVATPCWCKTIATEEATPSEFEITEETIAGKTITDCSALQGRWSHIVKVGKKYVEACLVMSPGKNPDCLACINYDNKEWVTFEWYANFQNDGRIEKGETECKPSAESLPHSVCMMKYAIQRLARSADKWKIVAETNTGTETAVTAASAETATEIEAHAQKLLISCEEKNLPTSSTWSPTTNIWSFERLE